MEKKELLKNIDLYLFDMDGTLYLGKKLFPFTKELLETIRAAGKRYMFMTNNSSSSVNDYVAKLDKLGIAATKDDFITSTQATAHYLKENYPDCRPFVCGTKSFRKELYAEGFFVTNDTSQATCIVMGFDKELTYKKLEDICFMFNFKGDVPYVATNPDYVCPTEYGSIPDCGSICDMIYNATGKRPYVIGKPNPLMVELAIAKCGVSKEKTAVVGDRIYTDIKSAINAGVNGILVMSGETTPEILAESADKPTLVLQDASEIMDALK